ncbi:MAG: UDP-N-acetylmuramoyl-L-alanyl-D-glutamate--2,6-diaminopimelate ligase [Hyphomicrobiaceae bacterium]|nr:UDP-N-acetylmuramoyl-L-alanyl-D-glutamate--2,6-diaminopimelate ligase [Hyphomicrobiaceae bacterium]MCC0010758.1 UDP-N-acetylmuramoyl-L-alanyl-D-glutamate--2,6-diaminopimelate ligase [Hyphomicrobiaceae bacterium]
MLLTQLLGPEIVAPDSISRLFVTGLTADSRQVAPGFVFAALPGSKVDGARFIGEAAARGAVAVLAGHETRRPDGVSIPVLTAQDPRRALALMAARFYPNQPATIVAVTGTSGKTSVADFARQIFAAQGLKAASLGTLGVIKPHGADYGTLTTPDPIMLHRTLHELAEEGITHVALEASSHGLDQHRLDGVRLTAGAFTNLGRDHLDYHPTLEDYLTAKQRLFTRLMRPGQRAVINTDGPMSEQVADAARARGLDVSTVGTSGWTVRLLDVKREGFAQVLRLGVDGRERKVRLPLIGAYQVENALTATALALAVGVSADDALKALENLHGVPGRLDAVGQVRGALVVVDYAHKPEALSAVLTSVRPFAKGRLICVFGCGGDRDRGKRPIMGRIAVEKADHVIVTDDNPRSEEPAAIRAEILAEAPGAQEIGDRKLAIVTALAMAGAGDVVVIAGKGHETGQIIGDTVLPFSDHDVARAAMTGDGG